MLRSYHVILIVQTATGYEKLEFDIDAEFGSEAFAEAKKRAYPFKTIDGDWYYN